MFRGINAVNLDAKGRMAVPKRYHDTLGGKQVVLTIDTESPCLLLYPIDEWEQIEKKLAALPSFDARTRRIQRLLIGHATELELDSQGRILIPALLRDYATLSKPVMLVGQGKKFEIWSEDGWEKGRSDWLTGMGGDDDLPEQLQSISL